MLIVALVLLTALTCARATARVLPQASRTEGPPTVGYVVPSSSNEHRAALTWLRQNDRFQVRRLALPLETGALGAVDVLWVHLADSSAYAAWQKRSEATQKLKAFYRQGGSLLLTNLAARLPHAMGIEPAPPETRMQRIENDEHNDKKGYQSFRGHPVFTRGLLGGANVWDATRDYRIPRVGYFGDRFPEAGKVAGVERARNVVRAGNKLLIEYEDGGGRLLAAGAYVYLSRPNKVRVRLERFLENALLYLAGALTAEEESGLLPNEDLKTYWPHMENVPRQFSVRSAPLDAGAGRLLNDLPYTDLLLTRADPQDQFWDLAGRRAIIMGHENGGIAEVWTHPFKLLYDYETGIVTGDSVMWLGELPLRIEVRPASFTRIYQTPYGPLKQIIFPSLHGAGGVVHYEAHDETEQPLRLVVRFRTDLKYTWPYPKSALGNVYYAYDEGLNALHVRNKTGDFYGLMGGDLPAQETIAGQYGTVTWSDGAFHTTPTDKNRVYHAALFELNAENDYTLNYAFAGTNKGKSAAMQDYRAMLNSPRQTYAGTVEHYRTLLDTRVTLDTPNDRFDALFKWALVGMDRFFIRTPHLGAGLMAGYATSNPAGGTWASGTPGYAWYFGRDGAWTGLAVNAYGAFDLVKAQLKLMQRFQGMRGKIFHALNTAGPGVQQYNAADSTPLYIVLAADYLRASGDLAFIRESWPHLKQTMDFLYTTDTDGDGLIENTGVGHGWVEFGELGDSHTTFYLAGIWTQALADAAYMARQLGKDTLAQQYAEDADDVRRTLNTAFWNADDQFFYQAKNQDGSFSEMRTVLPAVPMYLGEVNAEKARPVLRAYASNAFSTDWGTRIITQYASVYDPKSYHHGSVWPLFTGWTALAEYEYGRPANGFMHIANSLYVKDDWALGYVEEVLHGETYRSVGFTHHQAWSETAILHPAITGMVGWKPDAPNRTAALQPQFPLHWPEVTVRNLRIGSTTVRLHMERSKNVTRYRLTLTSGPPVDIRLAPAIPDGQRITAATVNGRATSVSSERHLGLLAEPIRFTLSGETAVTLRHTGGVGMAPVVPHPKPGDASKGYRIIGAQLHGTAYRITLEGQAGTAHVFRLNIFDQQIESVEGATVEDASTSGIVRLRVPFGEASDRFARKTVVVHLRPPASP